FPGFDARQVTGLEIIRSNSGSVIRVERTNEHWQLSRPIYPAQSTAIENWLGLFHSLNRRAFSAEELQAQGGLAAFGLEDRRLTAPLSARADNNLLQQVLLQLQNARVAQFVSDMPGSDLEPYGLHAPEVAVAFGQGTNNLLTVVFGKSPTNNPALVYARRSSY